MRRARFCAAPQHLGVSASHFRFGSLSWASGGCDDDLSDPDCRCRLDLDVHLAFRQSFSGWDNAAEGGSFTLYAAIDWGDASWFDSVTMSVTTGGVADGWSDSTGKVAHEYSCAWVQLMDTWDIEYSSCCRIAALESGNANMNYRVVTTATRDAVMAHESGPSSSQYPLSTVSPEPCLIRFDSEAWS